MNSWNLPLSSALDSIRQSASAHNSPHCRTRDLMPMLAGSRALLKGYAFYWKDVDRLKFPFCRVSGRNALAELVGSPNAEGARFGQIGDDRPARREPFRVARVHIALSRLDGVIIGEVAHERR